MANGTARQIIREKLQSLYAITDELEALFARPFTLDGVLFGSIGEVLAAEDYGLTLFSNSFETHDAQAPCGKLVQIKATQGKKIGLRAEPEHLIVLKIGRQGSAEEIYNGPGHLAWEASGKRQKNGQSYISLARLQALMEAVPQEERLSKVAEAAGV